MEEAYVLAFKCNLVSSGHPLKLVNYLLSGVKLTVCLVGETRPWSGLTLLVIRLTWLREAIALRVNDLLSGVKLTVCLVGETRPWSGLTLLVIRLTWLREAIPFTSQ